MVLSNPAVPELLETEVGESVNVRTAALATFKELGPPDLVHLSKSSYKTSKVYGTYHYVTGVDTSSSSAVAAYLNTLTFSLGEEQIWFGKQAGWKIHTGIYCTYNAFSRVDVRVLVKIPGGVEAYVVDDHGDKHQASDQLWLETYLSAMLRCLLFSDDEAYSFISYWSRLNPLDSPPSQSVRFIEAFETLFFQGPSLGCVPEVQAPTLVNNYLVDGFIKFVKISGLYEPAIKALQRLAKIEPEALTVLARTLLLDNEEVQAVQTMHKGILENPRDHNLLELQAEYCLKKGKLNWALDSAIRAVNASPSEFLPWARLVQIYTKMGDYEQALLTLNSCPMATAKEQDLPKLPPPSKAHFPLPTDGVLDEVWNANDNDDQNTADPGLLKLPAPTLRSTFAKAYELLIEIVSNIGWDDLLKYRSNVFIMEEEYRKEKKIQHDRRHSTASKITIRSEAQAPEPAAKPTTAASAATTTESTPNGTATATTTNGSGGSTTTTNGSSSSKTGENTSETEKKITGLSTPSTQNLQSLEKNADGEIKSKRLCERWLDNLIMVLYEDIRVYTVWRAEYVHYQSQQLPYRKTALEWELFGMVALRLRHDEEAADAFSHSLQARFSHRVLWKLLDYYEKKDGINSSAASGGPNSTSASGIKAGSINGHLHDAKANLRAMYLDTVVKLLAWNHRWYIEFSPRLVLALRTIIAEDGAMLVTSMVEAKYKPQGVEDLVARNIKILTNYKALGTDA